MKKLSSLLLFGLILSACASTPTTSNPTSPSHLTGHILNWPGGPATVEVSQGATVLSQGTISAAGDLSLTLPDAATITPYLRQVPSPSSTSSCVDTITFSDPNTRWRIYPGFHVYQSGALIGVVGRGYGLTRPDQAKPGDYLVRWVFSDRPVNVTGTYSCNDYKATADLHLKAGWNVTIDEYLTTYDASGGYYEIRSSSRSDANAKWGFQASRQ